MAKVAQREEKLGNALKFEDHKQLGLCRKIMSVVLTPDSDIGTVIADNAGTNETVTVATTANVNGVIIDVDTVKLRPATGTTTADVVVVYKGDAVFAKEALKFGANVDTEAEINAVVDALEALDITVLKQI